ncbi:hypothetical protein [Streptomyces sp. HM190]|uniref:hypothetical protein n=1 Tax=Streptomyces sp. HM190 TaxID=2695266 RepID=UPI001916F250|nr:hypothetical protein [Streptomyces sp. HM190]
MRDEQPNARDPEEVVTVPRNARKRREKVREFALAVPGAAEEFPWGGSLAEADRIALARLIAERGTG